MGCNNNSSDDDSQEAVGARLKIVRKIIGLSKRDFAEKAGLSEQVFGPFENGKRSLTLSAAKMLRKTYGLSCLSPLELCQYILAKGVRKHGTEALF